jgi:hypothetical protein
MHEDHAYCIHEDSVLIPQPSDPHNMSQTRVDCMLMVHLCNVQQYCTSGSEVLSILKQFVHVNKLSR